MNAKDKLDEGAEHERVLDYAPVSLVIRRNRVAQFIHAAKAWLFRPSVRSAVLLLLFLGYLVGLWLYEPPRPWEVIETLSAARWSNDSHFFFVKDTNELLYRDADGGLRSHDTATGNETAWIGHTTPVSWIDANMTRTHFLTNADDGICVWDGRERKLLGRFTWDDIGVDYLPSEAHVGLFELSSDGTRLLVRAEILPTSAYSYSRTGPKKVRRMVMWDVSDANHPILIATGPDDPLFPAEKIRFSIDGKRVLAKEDRALWVGNAETLTTLYSLEAVWPYAYVNGSFSPDGNVLVVQESQRKRPGQKSWQRSYDAKLLDPATGNVLKEFATLFHSPPIFSPHSRWVVENYPSAVYDAQTLGLRRAVGVWCFLPDGKRAVVDDWESGLHICDLERSTVLSRLRDSDHVIAADDGMHIATLDDEDEIRIWRHVRPEPEVIQPVWKRAWPLAPLGLAFVVSMIVDARRSYRKAASN